MPAPASITPPFPIIVLHPVTNPQHGWAALLLALPPAANWAALPRLFGEFGLGEALGGLSCIVPLVAPESLNEAIASQLPAERMILLASAAVCADSAANAALEGLQRRGFRLMAQGLPGAGLKLPGTVSALAVPAASIGASARDGSLAAGLKPLPGPHLALGVDAPADFDLALAAGFSRFAGEYPLHPLPAQQQQGPSRALLLRLLGLVASDGDSRAIEELLKQTPALSYQLLKLVNSVGFSLTTKISNFGHAITLLGRRQLQRWLQLLLYAQKSADAQNPLMACAAMRASLTEALCKASGGDREEQERAFMTGMFSLLDKLFAMPLADIVRPLNLTEDVADAILRRGGRLGALLALSDQPAPTPEFGAQLTAVGLSPESYCQSLVHASQWAIQVNQGV